MTHLYYTPPSDDCFHDMKQTCMQVWKQYDNTYGYVDEKIGAIKDLANVHDNFMFMFSMFDQNNQEIVVLALNQETRDALRERLVAGGNSEEYLTSIGL